MKTTVQAFLLVPFQDCAYFLFTICLRKNKINPLPYISHRMEKLEEVQSDTALEHAGERRNYVAV